MEEGLSTTLTMDGIQSSEKMYICHNCNGHFNSYSELVTHKDCFGKGLETNKGEKLLFCERCNGRFYTFQELGHHLTLCISQNENEHTKVAAYAQSTGLPLPCPEGEFTNAFFDFINSTKIAADDASNIAAPAEVIEAEPPSKVTKKHPCKICQKEFDRLLDLKAHKKTCKDTKLYTCFQCQISFQTKYEFRTHASMHSSLPARNKVQCQQCYYCGLYCSHESALKQHMKVHTGEKPFECEVCGKGFSQKYNLNVHLKCHNDEKPFQCDQCGKFFRLLSYLKKHMKSSGHKYAKPEPILTPDESLPTSAEVHLDELHLDAPHVAVQETPIQGTSTSNVPVVVKDDPMQAFPIADVQPQGLLHAMSSSNLPCKVEDSAFHDMHLSSAPLVLNADFPGGAAQTELNS